MEQNVLAAMALRGWLKTLRAILDGAPTESACSSPNETSSHAMETVQARSTVLFCKQNTEYSVIELPSIGGRSLGRSLVAWSAHPPETERPPAVIPSGE